MCFSHFNLFPFVYLTAHSTPKRKKLGHSSASSANQKKTPSLNVPLTFELPTRFGQDIDALLKDGQSVFWEPQ